jgi:hypothetical protein
MQFNELITKKGIKKYIWSYLSGIRDRPIFHLFILATTQDEGFLDWQLFHIRGVSFSQKEYDKID